MNLSSSKVAGVTVLCCFLGLVLSFYILHVVASIERDPNYRPLCDIREGVTCSKLLTSRWSKGWGILDKIVANDSILIQTNTVYAACYFTIQGILTFIPSTRVATAQVAVSIFANLMTIHSAYVILFLLNDICPTCIVLYVIKLIILVCNIIHLKQSTRSTQQLHKKCK